MEQGRWSLRPARTSPPGAGAHCGPGRFGCPIRSTDRSLRRSAAATSSQSCCRCCSHSCTATHTHHATVTAEQSDSVRRKKKRFAGGQRKSLDCLAFHVSASVCAAQCSHPTGQLGEEAYPRHSPGEEVLESMAHCQAQCVQHERRIVKSETTNEARESSRPSRSVSRRRPSGSVVVELAAVRCQWAGR